MQCEQCNIALPADARFCAGCGKPLPGAPGPAATAGSRAIWVLAFGVIGLFGVMIVGIIAAIAIPNFLNAVDRGKQKRTMVDLNTLAAAVENYSLDHDAFPVANDLVSLGQQLEPRYIDPMIMSDGWGHPFEVSSSETEYALVSAGKDGVLQGCRGGTTTDFDDDICLADGELTQWPAGLQR